MGNRGRKKQQGGKNAVGVGPLESRNVVMENHKRTSIRLEPSMWDALEAIAQREGMTINTLCTKIKERLDEQRRRQGLEPESDAQADNRMKSTFTSAVRVLIASYFVQAATEMGHNSAKHGLGDPFVGTPFDLPGDPGEGSAGGGGTTGNGPDLPGATRRPALKSRAHSDARYDM
ncbi:ribbon-helix-helix domain-containing protein [Azospirillum sp. sgz301742]